MRTVKTQPRTAMGIGRRSASRLPQLRPGALARPTTQAGQSLAAPYAILFLLGYIPGILLGRTGQSTVGQQLAGYYMELSNFTLWSDTLADQAAAAFLQLLIVVLCGFSVFGFGFLAVFFLGKGAFLGFCAANILAIGGTKSLFLYWLCSCLFNLLLLFLCLWLASHAAQLSRGLFQSAFLGGAPRGRLEADIRRLAVRSFAAVVLSGIFCILCSGLCVLVVQALG